MHVYVIYIYISHDLGHKCQIQVVPTTCHPFCQRICCPLVSWQSNIWTHALKNHWKQVPQMEWMSPNIQKNPWNSTLTHMSDPSHLAQNNAFLYFMSLTTLWRIYLSWIQKNEVMWPKPIIDLLLVACLKKNIFSFLFSFRIAHWRFNRLKRMIKILTSSTICW